MKRLYLTVEGQTEAAFVTSVLIPHLADFNVFVSEPRFTGATKRRRGRIPRGGLLNTFGHALTDIKNWLKEDKSTDARFSMMVDLYQLPKDFPGYEAGIKMQTGREQAILLQNALAMEIGDPRFIPYLQVHEYEALVLVDPQRLSLLYEIASKDIADLCQECTAYTTPEDINHGQYSHPKYRIEQRIPAYHANVAGPMIAEDIGLATLRSRCPHFGSWLEILEKLDS